MAIPGSCGTGVLCHPVSGACEGDEMAEDDDMAGGAGWGVVVLADSGPQV